ncbi:MAG: GAF domain-containing protein [Deltaproteobacteria bacterium]|nr:GAF domain-containing protein [Deltaproteobacteria bacterium]
METPLHLIKKIIQVANSNIDFEGRLQGILDILSLREGVDRGVLFILSPNKETLELKCVSPRESAPEVGPSPLARPLLVDCVKDRRPLFIARLNRKEHKGLLKIPVFRGFTALSAWPVEDDNYLYGVLCLLSLKSREFDAGEEALLEIAGRELAGVIRNSRIYTEAKKRIAELSVLYEVGKVIGATLELDELIQKTVSITAQVINARGAALTIVDVSDGRLKVEADFGLVPPAVRGTLRQEVLGNKGAYIAPPESSPAPDTSARKTATGEISPAAGGSFMCAPLMFKGPYQGRLCVYGRVAAPEIDLEVGFNQDDLAILSTIGNIIASSLENALTFQQIETLARTNEQMVKSLSILYQINSALMTRASYDELLGIILESITLKQGLGFNRAVLLLVNEESKTLDAVKGSSQASSGGAEEKGRGLSELDLSQLLLSRAERVTPENKALDKALRGLKISLQQGQGILVDTVLEGRSFLVANAREDPRTNKALVERLGINSFATIPIYSKDKAIGVIAVDHRADDHAITQEDMRILSMLGHQAGLAIENARLYDFIEKTNRELKSAREQLLESEKLTALGEMAAGMAHEIRNPLVSIGGFVRRLNRKFQGDSQVQTYFQVIINEVERLEKTLNEILDFSQDTRGRFQEADLNQIVEGALDLIRRELEASRVTVQKELSPIPKVYCDERQIRHVFYNLLLNALQAMPQGGVLTIRTAPHPDPDQPWVVCEIRDTGGGIPPELLHNIFNPFFTTKASGSGLGLSIVHKIITRHYGEVDIDNRPGEGVSFFIKLPLIQEAQKKFRGVRINGEENHEKNLNRR